MYSFEHFLLGKRKTLSRIENLSKMNWRVSSFSVFYKMPQKHDTHNDKVAGLSLNRKS
jgi:hypothetical protein